MSMATLSKNAEKQLEFAWDETIGSFTNSVYDGCLDDFDGITEQVLKDTLYANVTQCHFTTGCVFIGGTANREIRFQTKEALMNRINEMWDQDFQGDVSTIKPYLKG